MSEMFTKCNGFIVSGDPLVYADSATMTGQGTVSEPFGVKSTDLFVQSPLYTGTSGNSAYIGWNNETVLYEDYSKLGTDPAIGTTIQISEPISAFEKIGIYGARFSLTRAEGICPGYNLFDSYINGSAAKSFLVFGLMVNGTTPMYCGGVYSGVDTLTWTATKGFQGSFNSAPNTSTFYYNAYKIVGINRKA